MANLSYTNTPLIADLYDTPEAALDAASSLGCNGYRTYNINGETKYVPCSSFLTYEQSLRFKKSQGVSNAISGFGNIADKAVGLQFANANSEVNGDPFFTLGNFSISTAQTQTTSNGKNTIISGGKEYTAEKINQKNPFKSSAVSAIEQVSQKIENNLTVTVLFDKDKLKNYVLFSPFKETVKNSIIDVTNQFPAGLKMNVIGLTTPTITEYNYTPSTDTAEFKINLRNISNPYQIEYTTSGSTKNDDVNLSPLRNFSKTYTSYVLYYNGVEYRIINATLPASYEDFSTGLYLTVEGDPFVNDVNLDLTVNRNFWVKPKKEKYDEFYNKLPDMGKFLLNYNYDEKKYVSNIKYTKTTDNGVDINTNERLVFPQFDEVNIDLFSTDFDQYLTKLNDVADSFDATKSNLISRFLTTDSLREFDTDDRKVNLMFNIVGRNFDNIRKYVDGITFMTNLSYDKVENIPDLLIKNFGNMLGFQTYNIEDENTLVESLFNIKDLNIEPGLTPTEVDIELWRRVFINAHYLWKSKGTRKSIEFILNLVGLPDSIFEVNEYIYQARQKVNYDEKVTETYGFLYNDAQLTGLLPFDKDGYPTTPPGIRYQEAGFNSSNDNKNFGPYDFGRSYIDGYRKQVNVNIFDLDRVVDNVKSWAYSEEEVLRLSETTVGYTEYYEKDSRLIVNTKELEVYISSDKIFDITLYRFLNRNEIEVNSDLTIDNVTNINAGTLSFNQFMRESLDNYIKVGNRKTIKTYPTLSKIYFDYLKLTDNPVTQTKSLEFLNMFDSSWVKLVQQFTPATTILNAGKKIQNSKFLDNKFIYKHGLNQSVSWVGTDGSEFQNKANLPVNVGNTNPFDVSGFKKDAVTGESSTFTLVGQRGKNYVGTDPTINEYFGNYFGIEYACEGVDIYKWDPEKNYGDDLEFNGNVNTGTGPRYGVFVIYENNLYRLNTNRMFTGLDTINTSMYEANSDILLGSVDDFETITLPAGPGEYEISFTISSNDDLVIYDGGMIGGVEVSSLGRSGKITTFNETITFTTSTVTFWNMNNWPNDMIMSNLIIKQKHEPNRYKIGGENVYELIPLGVDASTIEFKDSPWGLISEIERKYYIEAVGIGHAYMTANDDYICPVPKPHTCYYDYSGLTINMATPGITSYYDETGTLLTIEQPKYYGYSKNTSTTEKPEDAVYGSSGNWAVPYRRPNTWTNGVVYYSGDVVTKSSVNYLVTGSTVTGYTVSGVPSGTTLTTIVPGLYQNYDLRTKTDPYMHIDSAYIKRLRLNPLNDRISINLSKNLYLFQVYKGATQYDTYKVTDNILNDELYLSDSTTITFDGLYSLDETKIGPFYTANTDEVITSTLIDTILLVADKDNYVDIQSLNTNFDVLNNNIGVGAGYYLVKNNAFLKMEFDLYFESEYNLQQDVDIKILNQLGEALYTQTFTFSGNDMAQDRIASVDYEDVFEVDSKIYLVIQPKVYECTLSRYEKIEIDYTEPTTYSDENDPRFRVLFNGGRSLIDGRYTDDVISIEPIVTNLNDFNIDYFLYKTDNILDTYKFRTRPNISISYDESSYFGLLYGNYYEKYKPASVVGDVSVYEKLFNNDKIDFNLVVRSKEPQSILNQDQSQEGFYREYTISSSDNYLGNTPQEIENTSLTKSIIIGKNPKPRTKKLNKKDFTFLRSYKNNNILNASASTIDFIGYDEGFTDYDLIDFNSNIEDSFLEKRRYITATGYYEREKSVYGTQLYKDILAVVPYFDQTVNNYKVNDIVKVKLTNYNAVVETETGTTIEVKSVDRLYVCVEDITTNHLRKKTGVSYLMNIHPVYQPNGARASFIPIEEYDVRSFTPIGYDKYQKFNSVKANQFPYKYETVKQFAGQPTSLFDIGDIIKVAGTGSTYTLYEYVYNKAIPFDTTNVYPVGSFVYTSGSTYNVDGRYSFWMKKTATGTTIPVAGTNWQEFRYDATSITGTPFYTFVDPSINPDHPNLALSPSAYRLKNLIPTMEDGTGNRIYIQYTGVTNMVFADIVPSYLPMEKTNNQYDGVDVIDYLIMTGTTGNIQYSGTTGTIYTGYTLDTNLIQNNYTALNANTLPSLRYAGLNQERNVTPLFHRLCTNLDDDSIYDWSSTKTYAQTTTSMSGRYALNRNVLYRSVSTTSVSGTTEPYADATKWVENDFMLVKAFTFYKDRTRVKVYEGKIESLDSATKNSLYFFKNDLTLKNGFTENSFSGTTKNNKLLNGLNKLADAKNENVRDVNQYGLFGFRKFGSDIIMDYYYARDNNNLPLTGEFIGGLTLNNPCGHHAKVIFGLLLDADFSDITELSPRQQTQPALPIISALDFNPNVRLIINQNGASDVTVTVTSVNGGVSNGLVNYKKSLKKYEALDKSFTINEADSIIVKVTYDTNLNKTKYANGIIDGFKLFETNDVGINNEYVVATKSNVGKVVTRTITLKNVYEDRVIKLDFNGANYTEINTVDPKDFIKF